MSLVSIGKCISSLALGCALAACVGAAPDDVEGSSEALYEIPPWVELSAPRWGATFTQGDAIPVSAVAHRGQLPLRTLILRYESEEGLMIVYRGSEPVFNGTMRGLAPGKYVFEAVAQDALDNTDERSVEFTVLPKQIGLSPTVASIGYDYVGTDMRYVQLKASAMDPDGTVVRYTYFRNGKLSSGHERADDGFVAKVRVTDNDGNQAEYERFLDL